MVTVCGLKSPSRVALSQSNRRRSPITPRLSVTSSVVLVFGTLRTWFSLSLPLRYSEYFTSLPSPLTSEKPPTIWSSPPALPSCTMKLKAP